MCRIVARTGRSSTCRITCLLMLLVAGILRERRACDRLADSCGCGVLVALCVWVSVRVMDRAIASMDLGDLTDDEV